MGKTFITNTFPDLQIAERNRFQNKINTLESELRKSCTPEMLDRAEHIAEEFRKSLVFKYISAENSIVNLAVCKLSHLHDSLIISFYLNGKPVQITLPDLMRINRAHRTQEIVDAIGEAVIKELTKTLLPEIILETLEERI